MAASATSTIQPAAIQNTGPRVLPLADLACGMADDGWSRLMSRYGMVEAASCDAAMGDEGVGDSMSGVPYPWIHYVVKDVYNEIGENEECRKDEYDSLCHEIIAGVDAVHQQ